MHDVDVFKGGTELESVGSSEKGVVVRTVAKCLE